MQIAENSYIKSPLNYTGGKYRILNQIIPLFPKHISTFVDLFGGGFNVGINVNARSLIYNDVISQLCELLEFFYENNSDYVISRIEQNISKFGLNKYNTGAFLMLRDRYNSYEYDDQNDKILDFYTLILYSFNYQIRFNKKMKFNTPFGKNRSSFNPNIKKNLIYFIDAINNKDIVFSNSRFTDIDFSFLSENDFVYCDPPYLITTGSYNDGCRGGVEWNRNDEVALLSQLDYFDNHNIKFALSNVFCANNRINDVLLEWSKRYNVYYIANSFNNSNYRRKTKDDTKEVLITNY